jgi:4-amino-4-deoxy-L-arabinose transferase-like glycosyltransferase
MVGLILCSLWAFYRWQEEKTWKWAFTAGLLSGMAIFVKNVALFPLLGAFALVILSTQGLKQALKDPQMWTVAVIAILPTAIYMVDGLFISKDLDTTMGLRFFPGLWMDPAFYVRWKNIIGNTLGFGPFILALLGIFMTKPGIDRSVLLGVLLGYLVYGFVLPYHISTHNYYQLTLVVFIALSLSMIGKSVFQKIVENNGRSLWLDAAVVCIILFVITAKMWNVHVELARDDYREEPRFWAELGDRLGHTSPVLGLTQDYGNRLAYWGWQSLDEWPTTGDQDLRELAGKTRSFDEIFSQHVVGKQYFVVTNFKQFDSQPELKDKLFKTYPIIEQSPDYIIFDLQHQVVRR